MARLPAAQSRHVRVIPQRHRDLYTKGNAFAYFLFSTIPIHPLPTTSYAAHLGHSFDAY